MSRSLFLLTLFYAVAVTGTKAQSTYEPYSFTTLSSVGAQISSPRGVAVDAGANLFVANTSDHTIVKITPAGVASVFAGQSGIHGSANGIGPAAQFFSPSSVAFDGSGNLYVADTDNHTIRKISPVGEVTTFAGFAGQSGSADGTGSAARFYGPRGVALDGSGNIYVADTYNSTIRKITAAAVTSTLAGKAGQMGSADGNGDIARFNQAIGIAADSAGNVYVADTDNHTIRKIVGSRDVSTLAGLPGAAGDADRTGCAARFRRPQGITVDSNGTVYVADTENNIIRKVTSAGAVTTLAGKTLAAGSNDGTGSAARFIFPLGIAVDNTGTLFVTDGNDIRRGIAVPQSPPTTRTVTNTNDAGPGSLRQALADAHSGDTINFSPSLNGQAITLTSGQLTVDASVTVSGPGANLLTIRRASVPATPAFRIFSITPDHNVAISGLSILNGNAHGEPIDAGGGIYNHQSYLTVDKCTFSGNTAEKGGALCNDGGTDLLAVLTITNSTLNGNSAAKGGGIYNGHLPDTTTSDTASVVSLANSTLSGNSASDDGGGLYNSFLGFNEATIVNCTFSGNSAPRGAGIETTAASCAIGNSIFKNGGPGPNITKDGSNPPLRSFGYNLLDDDANHTDPRLGPLQDNGGPTLTHAPLPDSPAIDRGKNLANDACNIPVPTDQRGFPRTIRFSTAIPEPSGGDGTDIGAVELSGPAPILGNISSRLSIGQGEKVLIGGFIIEGSASKKVLILARGPSLSGLVANPLPNPRLELHDDVSTIANNNDWQTTQIGGVITADQRQDIENSGLAPGNSADAAIIATLPAGHYTAVVQDVNGASGVGIVEVFDLTPNVSARLANISTRGFVQTGDNVMIGGIIVVNQPTRVIVRAGGPSLTGVVSNPLPNPVLELHDQTAVIARNDDWHTTQVGGLITTDQSQEIQNSGFAPSNSAESAMIVTLQPGTYTAIVRDANGASGIGIVEVFALP